MAVVWLSDLNDKLNLYKCVRACVCELYIFVMQSLLMNYHYID